MGQNVWACEKPTNVSEYDVGCLQNGLAKAVVKNPTTTNVWNVVDKTGKTIFKDNRTAISNIEMRGPISVIEAYDMDWYFNKTHFFAHYVVNTRKFYNSSGDFKENRIYVLDFNDNYGYLDETGKEVIPLIYQSVYDFSNGLAAVKKDGKWGYIDTNGKVVINFQYEYVDSFKNGKARVAFGNDGKTPEKFYIDKTGKILTTRTSLADFRKKLEQGDDIYYQTNDDFGKGMILEIKGNLVQVQTKKHQCTQRDHKDNCKNYIENQVGKWIKKSEVYPSNHLD